MPEFQIWRRVREERRGGIVGRVVATDVESAWDAFDEAESPNAGFYEVVPADDEDDRALEVRVSEGPDEAVH